VSGAAPSAPGQAPAKGMRWIPGGKFMMGSDVHYPEETPAHPVAVDGFWMDEHPVTNLEFLRFVKATGYETVMEHPPDAATYPGATAETLVTGSIVFVRPKVRVDLSNAYNWWHYVPGADWRHPEGPDSSLAGRDRHPVVHVAWADAVAYATWAGKELPTEAEWEFAARGGLEGAEYAWGDEFSPRGRIMANTWQGEFPIENSLTDGYERTSPVGTFAPNGYGLFDVCGNVWEWTCDYWQSHSEIEHACCTVSNPLGGGEGRSYDPNMPGARIARRVLKGGSYLCAPNYCHRYRPAARIAQEVDSATGHLGFRCIARS
jgi:sulfatase modifying factor 1